MPTTAIFVVLLRMGVLLKIQPLVQRALLAGQEHGRTIPLAALAAARSWVSLISVTSIVASHVLNYPPNRTGI